MDDHISSKKDFYTSSLKTFDTNKSLIPIEDRFLVPKPWMMLDGVNNNKVYCPIGDNNILMLTRLLDFSKIHPDVILDAIVARNLIDMSCASLSKYILAI